MLSHVAKFLFAATSVAPALLTYALVALWMHEFVTAGALVLIAAVFLAFSYGMLKCMRRNLERMDFKVKSVEVADHESTSLLLVYILPLLRPSFEFAEIEPLVWTTVLVVLILLMSTGYGYHFNPLLNMLGWHFYKVGTPEGVNYVLITKKRIRNVKKTAKIGMLTEYIAIDVGGADDV